MVRNTVTHGEADFSNSFTDHTVARLNGDWYFWQDELLTDETIRNQIMDCPTEVRTQQVPANWSDVLIFQNVKKLSRSGTLAVRIHLPEKDRDWMMRIPDANAACRLFADGTEIAAIGNAVTGSDFLPGKDTAYARFHVTGSSVLISMHITNEVLPYTGTWAAPIIGTPEIISTIRRLGITRECLISGAMLAIGLYHLFLYLLRRNEQGPLFFACICFFMTIRNMIMGERILMPVFAETFAAWRCAFVFEHLSAHLCLPLFFIFIKKIYPKALSKLAVTIVCAMSGLWALLEIATPPMIHHRFLSLFEYFTFVGIIYIVGIVVVAAIKKYNGASLTLAGLLILACTAINDVLLSNGIIQTVYLLSYGLLAFLVVQSFFLARRSSRMFLTVERYVVELRLLNRSLERFIPREMLGYLNKKSIADVRLGDYSDQAMTVFFLDIRNFTSFSEELPSEETFKFINTFLSVFGPIVRAHGGFVDKYLGDGFMALFPDKPDDAIAAAIEMRSRLPEFNRSGNCNIDFGIGIHTGSLTLGTIGETQRMDSTVISDTVNTASRLEQLNKVHGNGVLVSAQTIAQLHSPELFSFTKIGEEKVKGKEKLLNVYRLCGNRHNEFM